MIDDWFHHFDRLISELRANMRKLMIVTTLGLLLLCGQVAADDSGEMEGAVEEGRFAFVSFTPDGSLTLTFNTTSLQYAIMAGFTGLIIASIILPLLGLFSIASRSDPHYGYAYTDPSGYTQSAYDTTASQALYSKRYATSNHLPHTSNLNSSMEQGLLFKWSAIVSDSLSFISINKVQELDVVCYGISSQIFGEVWRA